MVPPDPRTARPGALPAQRFARPTLGQPPDRPGRAVAAGLLLLVLVTGIPVGLLLLAGLPTAPTSIADAQTWLRQVDVRFLLDLLVILAWLAWLQFTVSVVVEIVAALRGGVLAQPVPFAGPSQRLARSLVGALLLSAALGQQIAPAAAAVTQSPTPVAASPVVLLAADPASGHGGDADAGDPPVTASEPAPAVPGAVAAPNDGHAPDVATTEVAPELTGQRIYTVHPPQGRHHDNLWHIAERFLGDGRRYHEIYELNAGRVQPDGRTLELARLIQPGWQLVMPEDAVAVPRMAPAAPPHVPPTPPGQGVEPAPEPAAPPTPAPADHDTGAAHGSPAAVDQAAALDRTAAADQAVAHDVTAYLGGGLLAAGVVALVALRRRAQGGAVSPDSLSDTEVVLRLRADEGRAELLDRALRLLAQRCTDVGRSLPGIYAAVVDSDSVRLRLSPGDAVAPAPWESQDGGDSWLLPMAALPRATLPVASVYPYLVSLGTDDADREILIDLAAAGGVISLTGSPAVAEQVLAALTVQLAVNAWSGQARVIGWRLPPAAAAAVGPRLSSAVTLADALASAGPDQVGSDVVTGRPVPGSTPDLRLVVIGGPMDATERRDLAEAGSRRRRLGVLAIGDVDDARWRLSVDDAGTLSVAVLGLVVRANRLDTAQAHDVAGLLAAAAAPPAPPVDRRRPDVPDAPAAVDDIVWRGAPARVAVLGPAVFRAPGQVDPQRRGLIEDIVLYLATHPDGVHPSVLGAAVWPRGVGREVVDAAVARSRDWLGTTADGSYRLGTTADGRLRLRDVVVDLDVLHALLAHSRAEADPGMEIALLRRAMRLIRGEVLQPRPMSRFTWLVREPLEQRTMALVVDAANRLARLQIDDDPAGASEAARTGLRIAPAAQQCWQDLLVAEHRLGGRPAVEEVAVEMRHTLSRLDVEPDAETVALIEELSPRVAVAG